MDVCIYRPSPPAEASRMRNHLHPAPAHAKAGFSTQTYTHIYTHIYEMYCIEIMFTYIDLYTYMAIYLYIYVSIYACIYLSVHR